MRKAVSGMQGYYERGMGFLFRLAEVCPQDLWAGKGGGFRFWQQLYHAFWCVDYFLLPPDGSPPEKPFGRGVALFTEEPGRIPSREEILTFGNLMKARADEWIAGLDDMALGEVHAGFTSRKGSEITNAAVFTSLAGHIMYHVGCCDSVLRDNGIKGVY